MRVRSVRSRPFAPSRLIAGRADVFGKFAWGNSPNHRHAKDLPKAECDIARMNSPSLSCRSDDGSNGTLMGVKTGFATAT